MDNTSSTTAYWVLGIIIVLAVLLGAWLWLGGTNVGIPNTGTDVDGTNQQQGTMLQ